MAKTMNILEIPPLDHTVFKGVQRLVPVSSAPACLFRARGRGSGTYRTGAQKREPLYSSSGEPISAPQPEGVKDLWVGTKIAPRKGQDDKCQSFSSVTR